MAFTGIGSLPRRRSQPLAGADGQLQAALGRGIRTIVRRVEQAERMVRAIEVEIVETGGGALEVEISAARVRLDAVRQVAERNEEAPHVGLIGLDERAERQRLSLERKRERADA